MVRKTSRPLIIPKCLKFDAETRELLQAQIDLVGEDFYRFNYTTADQGKYSQALVMDKGILIYMCAENAFQLLTDLDIHIPDQISRDVGSKLAIRSSSSDAVGHNYKRCIRIYQCQCGVDHTVGHQASKKRYRPWENLDCSMFARVVTTHDERDPKNKKLIAIDEVSGFLEHVAACKEAINMIRNPTIALHPDLREYALSLLRDHIPMAQVRLLARTWAKARWGSIVGDNHHRFVLLPYESVSLYRTLTLEKGIPRTEHSTALDNIDRWFRTNNPLLPTSAPRLTKSCLFYHPFGPLPGPEDEPRFALILSTPRQQEMAWRFGHKQQVLMDGTFGLCSSCILVFFLLVIDDRNIGVPVGTIIFSPKTDAKAGHASYDQGILTFLLGKFKMGMGLQNGEEFRVDIGTTDNDKRERYALENQWPDIRLILCMFHTWQAWRNNLNKKLACIPKGPGRQEVRTRLGRFLMHLLKDIIDYDQAITAYNEELTYFRSLATPGSTPLSKSQSKAGVTFLVYLHDYLSVRAFWKSWSRVGAIEAAEHLGVAEHQIARTNNHLESFNGRMKSKYFTPYSHSNRLPRIDVWVLQFVTTIIPDFFTEYDERKATAEYYTEKRHIRRPTSSADDSLASRPSLIPNSIPSVEQASAKVMADIDNDIEDDNLVEGFPNEECDEYHDELEDSLDDDQWLGILRVDIEGDGCSFAAVEASDEATDSDMSWDTGNVALSYSQIIQNLPSDAPEPELSDESADMDSIRAFTALFRLGPTPFDHSEEPSPMDWQTYLEVEDTYIQSIHHVIRSSRNPEAMYAFISPRLGPHIITRLGLETSLTQPHSIRPVIGVTPAHEQEMAGPVTVATPPPLPMLLPQRKERRKESYCTR
ncbi:hypothetical protein EYR40_010998 [Pleurotus pulmonarius]|nr:hypothetical protein EYR36_002766 [Pleurotus pulmonarius]KAF4586980.1 hypothetical protein EYR40_010998 [Pleurotus pulmonarius]